MRLVFDTNVPVSALLVGAALPARLINELREVAVVVRGLPVVTVCPDRDDNYLLATAAAGVANFLVTGDKRRLLGIRLYGGARILPVREFLSSKRRLP